MDLFGKVQEFIQPTPIEDKYKELLRRAHEEILKPLGFKKDGQNFRRIISDGLGNIVHFWRDGKRGVKGKRQCFAVDIGLYFEAGPTLSNCKFTVYDCQLRNVAHNPKPVALYGYPDPQFWYIFKRTDVDTLFDSLEQGLREALGWFDHFESRQAVIDMILNGTAQQYSLLNVTPHLISEMLDEEFKEQLGLEEEKSQ